MPPRQQHSLDGTWTFRTDPANVGEREGCPDSHGFEREVQVPGPWQLYGPELVGYTGKAWYHRAFEVPFDVAGRELVVRFDAVDYEAAVWVNGRELARHEGGYTPFEVVIPAEILGGTNHLVLMAYDPKDNSEIPHGKQGSWYTRVSGPWQPVTLEVRDLVHLTAVHVTPQPREERASVRVHARAGDGTAVRLELRSPEGELVGQGEGLVQANSATVVLEVPSPRLWSPEDPALYTVTAILAGDTLEARFGMRWVEHKGGLIYLNGQKLYLRGALDQAFYPQTVYRAPSEEAIEHEIRLAKAMGLNLLRKHIKVEDPRYLDACDRLGMLLWTEPACFAKYTPRAKARFRAEIEGMIARDYNHPSIIAWSLYNEEWGLEWRLWKDPEKQAHVEELYHHAKSLDPTRLVCDNSGWAHVKTDINDCHRYFVAPEQLTAWEENLAAAVERPEENFVASRQANAPGVPVVVSEFGVWGLPEPSRIEGHYGDRPWWFEAQWAGHVEEFKYPATAFRSFERYGLDEVFGSMDVLAGHCQRRMMRALKPIIERMRMRDDLAGYVVTEFTDIEWESNGWLDYFRAPKAGFEQFPWFNGECVVMTRLASHNRRAGEWFEGAIALSNHGLKAFKAQLRWRVEGHPDLAGQLEVNVPSTGNLELGAGSLRFLAPAVNQATAMTLVLELWEGERLAARNEEELTVSPASLMKPAVGSPIVLYGGANVLADAFEALGLELAPRPAPDALVVTTTYDPVVRAHVEAGGRALFLAELGDQGPDQGDLSFRRLARGESWDRASSIMYARPGLFGKLPVGAVLGWEMEDLYPHHVLAIANYMHDFGGRQIELTSNQAALAPEHLLAGYFEGWLGKLAATIARVPRGHGTVLVTTLRLLEQHGRQPIGDAILLALLELA